MQVPQSSQVQSSSARQPHLCMACRQPLPCRQPPSGRGRAPEVGMLQREPHQKQPFHRPRAPPPRPPREEKNQWTHRAGMGGEAWEPHPHAPTAAAAAAAVAGRGGKGKAPAPTPAPARTAWHRGAAWHKGDSWGRVDPKQAAQQHGEPVPHDVLCGLRVNLSNPSRTQHAQHTQHAPGGAGAARQAGRGSRAGSNTTWTHVQAPRRPATQRSAAPPRGKGQGKAPPNYWDTLKRMERNLALSSQSVGSRSASGDGAGAPGCSH
jgi:hypothetical protein